MFFPHLKMFGLLTQMDSFLLLIIKKEWRLRADSDYGLNNIFESFTYSSLNDHLQPTSPTSLRCGNSDLVLLNN